VLRVASDLPPADFDVESHGDLLQKAWFACGDLGDCNIFIIETFLGDE
jgi:hypothetical protein